jgi:sec-independent protein translocase protein TatC
MSLMENPDSDFLKTDSVLAHLAELVSRVKLSFFFLALGMGISYTIAPDIVNFLSVPLYTTLPKLAPNAATGVQGLVIIDPFEKVWVQIRISGIIGIFLALPFMTWQIGKFIGPGLYSSERRKVRSLLLSGYLVFIVGLVLGYRYSLPLILKSLIEFGGMDQVALLSLSRYINAAIGVLLATAVLLEIPIAIFFTSLWGWISAKQWASGRRLAVVGNAVISAFLSPPDVVSMLALMVPIQILYEGGILAARMAEWKRREKAEL